MAANITMKLKSLFAVLLFIALAFSCKEETPTDNLFKFRDYISYTTSNRISVTEPIAINLTKEVPGWELDKEITDNIVSFSPNTSGRLVAQNKHSLLFYPD